MASKKSDEKEDMSGHTAWTRPEYKRWRAAAEKEGLSYQEFTRRAMNDRANKALNPAKGLLSGFAGMLAGAVVKEVAARVTLCKCGHPENRHYQQAGTSGRGSCGSAVCDCKKFEGRPEGAKG